MTENQKTPIRRQIESDLRLSLLGDSMCACGRMPVADVRQVDDVKFSLVRNDEFYGDDNVAITAACRMQCNVCGHVARKLCGAVIPDDLLDAADWNFDCAEVT